MNQMKITKRHLLYWRLKNQFLLSKGERMKIVSKLLGLQAQFAFNPKYALQIRASDFDGTTWSDGLIKTWTFRHTLHVIPAEELGLYLSTRDGSTASWTDGWGLKAKQIEIIAGLLMKNIHAGFCGRVELKEKCRAAGLSGEEMAYAFNGWGGIFSEMFRRGLIAYDPGGEKKFVVCKNVQFIDKDVARRELIRRYFRAFSPATKDDCFTFMGGYTMGKRTALNLMETAGLDSIICEGTEYFYTGEIPEEAEIPKCLFLSGFDQAMMGYKNINRTYLMDEKNMGDVMTPQGILFPTVLIDGKVRAKWKMGSPLLVTPFEILSSQNRQLIQKTGEKMFECEVMFR
jgi:hypothetical protein